MALGWKGSYLRYKGFFLNITELYKKRADFRAFLEIILSLSTVIIFLIFALKPTVITIVNLLQDIKQKNETLATLTQKENNLIAAEKLIVQNQAYIPDIDIAVPTIASPDFFIKQVEGLANQDSVSILGASIDQTPIIGGKNQNTVSLGVKALPEGAKPMPFSITVRGNYENLTTFIKDFENLRVTTKIDGLEINSSTTDQGRVIVAVISGREPFIGN